MSFVLEIVFCNKNYTCLLKKKVCEGKYLPFCSAMRIINETITLKDLHILLLSEEQSIKNIKDYSKRSTYNGYECHMTISGNKGTQSSFTLKHSRSNYNRGCGRNNSNTVNQFLLRRQIHSDQQRPLCQIYGEARHVTLDCYHCMDYSNQGKQPQGKLAARARWTNLHNRELPEFLILVPQITWHQTMQTFLFQKILEALKRYQ